MKLSAQLLFNCISRTKIYLLGGMHRSKWWLVLPLILVTLTLAGLIISVVISDLLLKTERYYIAFLPYA